MSFYSEIASDAAALIAEFGADVVLTPVAPVANRTVKGLFLEIVLTTGSNFGDSGIKVGDWKFLLDATANPLKGELLKFGAEKYSVVFVEPIRSGGVVVANYVWARVA